MPSLALPVPEAYKAIERPVAIAIAKRLAKVSGIQTPIIISFPGASEAMPLYDSRLGQDTDADSAIFRNKSKFSITVAERYAEGSELTSIVRSRDTPVLFQDVELGIELYPVYSSTEVTMSFTYRASDKREAEIFRDQYRTKLAEGIRELVMNAEYEIVIPKPYVMILKKIHELREAQGGYGESWPVWMNKKLHAKSTVLANMAGEGQILAFKERQEAIIGYWDFDLPPEVSKGETGSTYELSMDFIYTYDKPIMFAMVYPTVIHNQLLPAKYRPTQEIKTYGQLIGEKGALNDAMDRFRSLTGYYYNTLDGITQPFFDEFKPAVKMTNMFNALTSLVRVDPLDLRQVMGLNEFSPYRASQGVLDTVLVFRTMCTIPGNSPIHICVFEDGVPISENEVLVDEFLNVTTTRDLDIRKTYHLGIYLLTNPAILQPAALQLLLNNPTICLNYADTLRSLSNEPDYVIIVLANRLVNSTSWWHFVRTLRGVHEVYRNKIWQSWNLVQSCTVLTERL